MEVVLASKSPRRRMLLQAAGFAVEVRPTHIPEELKRNETLDEAVVRLAKMKADAVEELKIPVIAADTMVAIDGNIFGQPRNLAEAEAMLHALSGRDHRVTTGVCVRLGNKKVSGISTTTVRFRSLTGKEITAYLKHNEVLDKAGAYAVQGGAASFIVHVDGPLDNVMGLPVALARALLKELGT